MLSTDNLQELVKNNEKKEFELQPLIKKRLEKQSEIDSITNHLFNDLPFYEGLLFSKKNHTLRNGNIPRQRYYQYLCT